MQKRINFPYVKVEKFNNVLFFLYLKKFLHSSSFQEKVSINIVNK